MALIISSDSSPLSEDTVDVVDTLLSLNTGKVKHEEAGDSGLGDSGSGDQSLPNEGHQVFPTSKDDSKSAPRRFRGSPINPESLSISDRIIMNMKQERSSDREIAEHLEEKGLATYKPKTISTRYVRIRKRVAEHLDEQFERGQAVWDAKNDSALLECIAMAKRDIAKSQRDAEAKLWKMVSDKLQKRDRTLTFSARGCGERYESIVSGKLPIYPELKDSNLYRDVRRAQGGVLQAKHAQMEAERKADTLAREAIERYQNIIQTPPTSPRLTIPAHHATNSTRLIPNIRQELARLHLPAPPVMNREEIEAEMAVRGYQAYGNLNTLRDNLYLARRDHTFPAYNGPCDIAKFKKMLKEKEIWEYDSDETIEDEEVVGIHVKPTTINTSEASPSRNDHNLFMDQNKVIPTKNHQDRPVKKPRIETVDLDGGADDKTDG